MSNNETMQVGPLELRKTNDGWEYLSEGLGNDPDQWVDAASSLGPFSGSGVNNLLNELAATKAHTSSREDELLELIQHIRGCSSCSDVWDHIDSVVPYTGD